MTATTNTLATKPKGQTWVPRADVYSGDEAVVVTVDLPGVDEASLNIELEKNLLTIEGAVKTEVPDGYRQLYSEYTPGNYRRRFVLSDNIEREGIEAKLDNGVLNLRFPKAKAAVAKKIAIKST